MKAVWSTPTLTCRRVGPALWHKCLCTLAFSAAPQRQHTGVRIPARAHPSGATVCEQVQSLAYVLADEPLAVARFDNARGEGRGQRPEPDHVPVPSRVAQGYERRRAFWLLGVGPAPRSWRNRCHLGASMRARRRSTYSNCSFDGCFGSSLDRLGVVDAIATVSNPRPALARRRAARSHHYACFSGDRVRGCRAACPRRDVLRHRPALWCNSQDGEEGAPLVRAAVSAVLRVRTRGSLRSGR